MLRLYNLKNTGNILSKGINISSYFPDKAQEIRNYRNAFEQEKYNREQSASQNRDSAREKCYEVINKYM